LKTRSYQLRPAAREDLRVAVDYLRQRDPLTAIRFVEAAQATFEHLCNAPLAYPLVLSAGKTLRHLRWRPLTGAFRRWLVFYELDEECIDIVRVLHAARDIPRLLEQ
jgi:toxin ParE1/3/4